MSWLRCSLMVLCVCASVPAFAADDQEKPPAEATADTERANLEKGFEAKLSGSVLVGHFSVDGKEDEGPGRPERYEITKVSKLKGNYWVFNARIKYGKVDATVPITLKVLWAGDTPMISLTDLTIPGMGTFTSRVFFYGDRYAGTWQHGKVGGHMWGKIEKIENDANSSTDANDTSNEK